MKILHSKTIGDSNNHIIILQGFLGMGDNWKTHAKKIALEGFTVHLLDLRNHGRSFWDDDFSFDSMAEDIHNYLKSKNISKVDLIGHSMGGNLAFYISNKVPDIINKIVIVDIAPKKYAKLHEDIFLGLKSIDFNFIRSRKEVDEKLSLYITDDRVRQFLLKSVYWESQQRLGFRFNLDILYDFSKKSISNEFKTAISFNGPSLFLHGELSNYVSEKDYELINYHYNNASIIKVPNSGHWLHVDNPDFFLEKTINFLNS
ncbi:MAG: alpha/beta fold hydrolase [Bacteroidota bacterium]|nr:alpha/beta fold hydrolase [Bacteroidota bacterium]